MGLATALHGFCIQGWITLKAALMLTLITPFNG
jgi:hypothetical protein